MKHIRKTIAISYLLLLDLILLCSDDAFHTDKVVVVAVEVLGLLVGIIVCLLAIILLLLLFLFVTHCNMKGK
jgi:hypothetical protein